MAQPTNVSIDIKRFQLFMKVSREEIKAFAKENNYDANKLLQFRSIIRAGITGWKGWLRWTFDALQEEGCDNIHRRKVFTAIGAKALRCGEGAKWERLSLFVELTARKACGNTKTVEEIIKERVEEDIIGKVAKCDDEAYKMLFKHLNH
eukprot:273952_1